MKWRFLVALVALALGMGIWAAGALAPPIASAALTTFEVKLTGASENPPVTKDPVSAFARFRFDDAARTLEYAVTVSGASSDFITAAHIHRGAIGVNGPIVYTLSSTGFTQVSGKLTLTDSDVIDLLVGDFYINVHTKDNPGGAARGQLDVPITSGDLESAYRRFVAVGNRGNIDAILAYYAPDASLAGGTICVPQACVGRDAIKRHFDNVVATHTDIRNATLTRTGNDVGFRTEVTNDGTKAAGVDRIIVTGVVTFAGDKIAKHSVGFDPTDAQTGRFLSFVASRITPPATGDAGLAGD